MNYVTLNNGVKMPLVGFGVFEIPKEETARCVYDALEVGYRLIDTAQAYYNEEQVGDGIEQAMQNLGIKREDIFLTTKVWVTEFGYEKTKASVEESLKKLRTDYLDLVLIHQCLSDYYGAYRALEDLYDEGKIRAIGISNFSAERMTDIATFHRIVPAVNQVETHMFWQQYYLHAWMEKYNIQHEAWGPLAQHRLKDIMMNPIVKEIAEKHGKSSAQIALRQHVQRGIVIIPKSTHKDRMKQNLDIFDFELTKEEMEKLKELDENKSMWAEYDDPMIVQYAMSEEGNFLLLCNRKPFRNERAHFDTLLTGISFVLRSFILCQQKDRRKVRRSFFFSPTEPRHRRFFFSNQSSVEVLEPIRWFSMSSNICRTVRGFCPVSFSKSSVKVDIWPRRMARPKVTMPSEQKGKLVAV